jgi:hypothetical protein
MAGALVTEGHFINHDVPEWWGAGEPIEFTADGTVEADLADPPRALALIVYEIPVVTGLDGDPPPGIDFAAELADLQQDQQLQIGRARRWWSWAGRRSADGLKLPPADQAAGELEECLMDVGTVLPAGGNGAVRQHSA